MYVYIHVLYVLHITVEVVVEMTITYLNGLLVRSPIVEYRSHGGPSEPCELYRSLPYRLSPESGHYLIRRFRLESSSKFQTLPVEMQGSDVKLSDLVSRCGSISVLTLDI